MQKPYMERRAYATGKIWMPNIELIMTSPPIPFNAYPYGAVTNDYLLNSIVGDLQRIIEYPKQSFQIAQNVPPDVLEAYEFLMEAGYTKKMI